MAIMINNRMISTVVTSSIMGHSGGGMFPLTLTPAYNRLRRVIRETNTTNLTKSSTHPEYSENFRPFYPWTWRYVQRLGADGLLNAYGLTNNGVKANAAAIASAQSRSFNVIPSFYPQFIKGRAEAINDTLFACGVYNNFLEDFWALEINFSCPNSREKIRENMKEGVALVKAVKQAFPRLCLIAKISFVHPYKFAQKLVDAGVDVIHAINTIPYGLIYPDTGCASPLAHVGGGGVSGSPIRDKAITYNQGLRKVLKSRLIMGGGIMSVDDAARFIDIDADVISLCTVARLNPEEAEKIICRYN